MLNNRQVEVGQRDDRTLPLQQKHQSSNTTVPSNNQIRQICHTSLQEIRPKDYVGNITDAVSCHLCERKPGGGRSFQQNAANREPRTNLILVETDSASGRANAKISHQVKMHDMRRVYQRRHKPHIKSRNTLSSVEKGLQTLKICPCQAEKTMEIAGPQTTLGQGRRDPFLNLSMPHVPHRYGELIDHCVTVLWPGLRGDDYSVAYAQEWLPIASRNPVVLNVFLFTASMHFEALGGPSTLYRRRVRLEQLQHKGEAIRGINEALGDLRYCQSEELIQNILFLAMNEIEEEEDPPDPSPFNAPLRNMQWLEMYGTRKYVKAHVDAVKEIIEKRGGIRSLRTVGLPWLVSYSELIFCASTLTKPQYPLVDPFGCDIFYQSSDDASIATETTEKAQGFNYFQALGLGAVINVFLALKDYSEALGSYKGNYHKHQSYSDNRNWVTHRVLSLPSVGGTSLFSLDLFSEDLNMAMLCYEACRLAATMYCIHVIFPVPRSLSARKSLLVQLKEAIRKIDLVSHAPSELVEAMLWCIIIGGIAAHGLPERSWFAAQLNKVCTWLDLTEWTDAKLVLHKFAWLGTSCDHSGTTFWNETL